MKKVLLLLAEGFEELEVVAPLDILRRGGIIVDVASTEIDLLLTGRNQISLKADVYLENCNMDDYELVLVPGGMGSVESMLKNDRVGDLLKKIQESNGKIGSICAGPLVLAQSGLLKGISVTSHPAAKQELLEKVGEYLESPVVTDGSIVTSRGAGTALQFGFELLKILKDESTSKEIMKQIVYEN